MNIVRETSPMPQMDRRPTDRDGLPVSDLPADPHWFEVRVYRSGWVCRVGRVMLRWHRDPNHAGLSLERVGRGIRLVGGKVWPAP